MESMELESVKEIMKVYELGIEHVEVFHIPLFFNLFTEFVNNNPNAQKYISGQNHIIFVEILDVGDFVVKIEANKMSWSNKAPKYYTLKIQMDLVEATQAILTGDGVTSYLAGNIELSGENAIEKALFYQGLIQLFSESLDIGH